MTSNSMCSASTNGSTGSSSSLAASLPGLSCPDPALADTLAPYPLSLSTGHHPGASPAVAPHPDVHLIEPAAAVLPRQCCHNPAACRLRRFQDANRP